MEDVIRVQKDKDEDVRGMVEGCDVPVGELPHS